MPHTTHTQIPLPPPKPPELRPNVGEAFVIASAFAIVAVILIMKGLVEPTIRKIWTPTGRARPPYLRVIK